MVKWQNCLDCYQDYFEKTQSNKVKQNIWLPNSLLQSKQILIFGNAIEVEIGLKLNSLIIWKEWDISLFRLHGFLETKEFNNLWRTLFSINMIFFETKELRTLKIQHIYEQCDVHYFSRYIYRSVHIKQWIHRPRWKNKEYYIL